MAKFASEKNAIGQCDRCGFRYPLKDLKKERSNLTLQNLRVCPVCYDKDNLQDTLGRKNFYDTEGLRDPRPDKEEIESRYGDSIRFEFKNDITDWAGNNSTISHDSTNGYLNQIWSAETSPSFDYQSASFDPETYSVVKARIILKNRPSIRAAWLGEFYWLRSGDGSFDSGRMRTASEPPRTMGDQSTEISYRMSGVANWDGTITGIRFGFYGGSSSSGEIDVDWVRLERSF